MPYLIEGATKERNSATLKDRAETKADAVAKAKGLREAGFEVVRITGPDGKPINETEDD